MLMTFDRIQAIFFLGLTVLWMVLVLRYLYVTGNLWNLFNLVYEH